MLYEEMRLRKTGEAVRERKNERIMKIIKLGDKEKLKETKCFLCKYCGCEFEADKGEYNVGEQYNEIYYCIPCPTCGKTVYCH